MLSVQRQSLWQNFLTVMRHYGHAICLSLCVLLITGLGGVALWLHMAQSQAAIELAERHRLEQNVVSISAAVEEQLSAILISVDVITRHLSDVYLHDRKNFDRAARQAISAFPDGMVQFVTVFDANGYLDYSTNGGSKDLYFGDREHFVAAKNDVTGRIFVSKPIIGRLSGLPLIQLTRSIRDGDKVVAVLGLPLRPEYLSKKLHELHSSPQDAISVVRLDGTVISHSRNLEQSLKIMVPSDRPYLHAEPGDEGVFRATSALDGVPLLFAWDRLRDWPLSVVVGVDEQNVLAELWQEQAHDRHRALWVIVISFMGAGLTCVLIFRIRRQDRIIANDRQRLNDIMEGAAVGTWEWNIHTGQVVINHRWAQILGYSLEELQPISIQTWLDLAHPEDLTHSNQQLQRHFRGEQPFYDCEARMRHKDGHWVWVLDRGRVHSWGDDGSPLLMSGTHLDITERKNYEAALRESEANFRQIFSDAPDAYLIMELNAGRICDCNQAAERMLRAERYQILDQTPDQLSPESQPNGRRSAEMVGEIILDASEKGYSRFEWVHRRLDGEEFWVEVTISVGTYQHRPVMYVSWREINEIVAARQELAVANAALERSNGELQHFAYAASHDLRQPLRMVSSYMALLRKRLRDRLDEDETQFLGFAVDGAKRMDRMVTDLLDYSRLGRDMSEPQEVDLHKVFELTRQNLEVMIAERGATVGVQGTLPVVKGVESQLERLLQNLISNGLKFVPVDRQPQISIECHDMVREWVIAVSDNGIGIAADDIGRLFKVFQRLVSDQQYEGTGIGLASCRKIVEKHGGRIWVESQPNVGSSFLFTLPKAV